MEALAVPRKGDWMLTASGRQFWPCDPHAADVDIFDIQTALTQLCRYGGHTLHFYSVAQHSVELARYFLRRNDPAMAQWALLHDAAEAYVADVIRPLKPFLGNYREIEHRVEQVVWHRYGLEGDLPLPVKDADSRIIVDEMAALFGAEPLEKYGLLGRPRLGVDIRPMMIGQADAAFGRLFAQLFPEHAS